MERLTILQEYLKDDPTDVFTHYAIALEYEKLGETQLSIEKLTYITAQFANYIPAFFKLGTIYNELSEIEKAKIHYTTALQLAKQQNDVKAVQEINEALFFLDDE